MKRAIRAGIFLGFGLLSACLSNGLATEPDPASVERGRIALTTKSFLNPGWTNEAFPRAGTYWDDKAPPADLARDRYVESFMERYGLHPAPFPNDGLPMGLRKAGAERQGIQIDCLVCHGGSIGGTSYVGLGNTTIDLQPLLADLTHADGKLMPPSLFNLNSARGTTNAGMISVVLLSLRNTDLSNRALPLFLGANLPELDAPAWWILGRKSTMYYDGRTSAESVRSILQFFLAEKSLEELKELEPTYRDVLAYLKSLKPPKYPFPINAEKASRGEQVFKKQCVKCHGTYGPGGTYPNRVVELTEIGTDPARALGLSDRFVAHYNATWFGEIHPASPKMVGYQAPPLDGIWATAPYLHNGSVPTLAALLDSSLRPDRFTRPPSTRFEHYDTEAVGWKFEEVTDAKEERSPFRAKFLYDTSRFGLGNGGHHFGDALDDASRAALIEYLKTL